MRQTEPRLIIVLARAPCNIAHATKGKHIARKCRKHEALWIGEATTAEPRLVLEILLLSLGKEPGPMLISP